MFLQGLRDQAKGPGKLHDTVKRANHTPFSVIEYVVCLYDSSLPRLASLTAKLGISQNLVTISPSGGSPLADTLPRFKLI